MQTLWTYQDLCIIWGTGEHTTHLHTEKNVSPCRFPHSCKTYKLAFYVFTTVWHICLDTIEMRASVLGLQWLNNGLQYACEQKQNAVKRYKSQAVTLCLTIDPLTQTHAFLCIGKHLHPTPYSSFALTSLLFLPGFIPLSWHPSPASPPSLLLQLIWLDRASYSAQRYSSLFAVCVGDNTQSNNSLACRCPELASASWEDC